MRERERIKEMGKRKKNLIVNMKKLIIKDEHTVIRLQE